MRKKWADGKVQRVEQILGRFVLGLDLWIEYNRQRRLDNECEERQRARAKERRARREEKDKREQARREELMSFVDDWEKAERIRNYLAALQAKLDAKGIAPSNPDKFAEWTEWARWYADFLCPITPTPLRQQSIEVPDNMPIAELDLTQSCRESLLAAPITDTNELYELTRKQIDELGKYGLWNEVNLVLEGLGYDVRGRSRW